MRILIIGFGNRVDIEILVSIRIDWVFALNMHNRETNINVYLFNCFFYFFLRLFNVHVAAYEETLASS